LKARKEKSSRTQTRKSMHAIRVEQYSGADVLLYKEMPLCAQRDSPCTRSIRRSKNNGKNSAPSLNLKWNTDETDSTGSH
jgi:hypothetical protein